MRWLLILMLLAGVARAQMRDSVAMDSTIRAQSKQIQSLFAINHECETRFADLVAFKSEADRLRERENAVLQWQLTEERKHDTEHLKVFVLSLGVVLGSLILLLHR